MNSELVNSELVNSVYVVCVNPAFSKLISMADDPSCSIIRHKKGKPLRSGEKTFVLNVFNKFCEKYPLLRIKEVESLTAEFMGVSVSGIHRVRNEKKKDGSVKKPIKTKKHKKPVLEKFDDFNKTAVRLKVHNLFFFKNGPLLLLLHFK